MPEPKPTLVNPLEKHHRDVNGGPARAAVFGVSDGLVTNVSLVLGVAGASASQGFVRLAGLAGLLAGAFSMATGEYISMKAQSELLEHELDMERIELARSPELETQELAALYAARGIDEKLAQELAADVMRDPEVALQAHAREELGVDPDSLGSPIGAAASSLVSFSVGAIVPLFPWFFIGGDSAVVISVALSALAAIAIGWALAYFTRRPPLRSAMRQLVLSAAAAAVTYAIGTAVGVGAT